MPLHEDRLYTLLMTQRADGSFPRSEVLTRWLDSRTRELDEAIARHGEAVITFVVAMLLEREAGDRQYEWQPARRKARAWLAQQPLRFDAASVIAGGR